MYEDVLTSTVRRDETESLAVVEPLHRSLHLCAPPSERHSTSFVVVTGMGFPPQVPSQAIDSASFFKGVLLFSHRDRGLLRGAQETPTPEVRQPTVVAFPLFLDCNDN